MVAEEEKRERKKRSVPPPGDGTLLSTTMPWSWKDFFLQWEWMLVAVLSLVIVVNSLISPFFLNWHTFIRTPASFLDKAFIVFPMMFVIILGKIDISVGSTVALSAVIMAVSYNAGLPMGLAILLCLGVGAAAGAINGFLLVAFRELSFVIVTLSTMIIYRGIAYIILGNRASGGFPEGFSLLAWGSLGGVPIILIAFVIAAVSFGLVLHKTVFGRALFAMGHNARACRHSGINTDLILWTVFTLNGLMAAVTAIFLTSRMGSTRPNVAMGYELEVIAMVALGGVSTSGGVGRIGGPVLAIFIVGFLGYGMGLANLQAPIVLVVIGTLLIVSVLAHKIRFQGFKLFRARSTAATAGEKNQEV
ncbi:ABC transporter permease [Alkalispirochaeta alkalica]|uniref:ABC transporter permease n=1 Tax=Alkalispirochaeta alkalica TaxID=46356 RepID=UPI00037DE2E0|nr:ABC transporter permease [Alkalispirochaeta alkalica]